MEFLGWKGHTADGFVKSEAFINKSSIIHLNNDIIELTIDLKRNSKIKLIDAIICSTAITNGLELITRNTDDFSFIKELKILNPFENNS